MVDDEDSEYGDPEPATAPPEWAQSLVARARELVGMEVYPPSDDTFLLLEALEADLEFFRDLKPKICLEIGCGSGTVSAGLLKLLAKDGNAVPRLIAVDKNPAAVGCTQKVLASQSLLGYADCLRGSFTDMFREGAEIDIVVCNPPYVPGDKEEMEGCGISVSWAGGDRGREVIDILLPKVWPIIARGGFFYLVCLAENEPEELLAVGRAAGLEAAIAKHETRGMEELLILRFHKPME